MSEKNNKSGSLFSNFVWKFAERFSAQLVSTVISIILARLLSPDDYGIISIVMIFINLANVFVSEGLGSSLIQKKNATRVDFFSVLYFNIVFSAILYIIIFFAAPFISRFYGSGYEILTPVLRVLGLRIILTSVNSVQLAYVSKKMIFKKYFISTLVGTIVSAVIGVFMAYNGAGVWALVAQYLSNTTISTIVLFFVLGKRPRFMFSFSSLKELFPYGMYILGTGLLITGYQDLRALIIGKIYTKADLAYYDKSRHFPSLVVTNINASISSVLFPKMSKEQSDINKVREHTKNSIRLSSFVICPMLAGLAAVAKPFIVLLLTEKWVSCVPLLQLFCIVFLFQPIHTANMQAIKAIGRGDVYMKLEILKKAIELVVLLITIPFGVTAIVVGMAVCATLGTFINAYPNIKFLQYGFKEQMADIAPNLVLSGLMFASVYALNFLPLNNALLLTIQVIVGITVYIFLSVLSRNKSFYIIWSMIKSRIFKRKAK